MDSASPAPAQFAQFATSPAAAGNVRFFPRNHGIAAGPGLNPPALSLQPRLLSPGDGTLICRGTVSCSCAFQVSVGSALCGCVVGQTSMESSCGVQSYCSCVATGLGGSGRMEWCEGISRICTPPEPQPCASGD